MKNNTIGAVFKILVVALAIRTLAGCITSADFKAVQLYPGPELQHHQVAELQACPPVIVKTIDGAKVTHNYYVFWDLNNRMLVAHILPGSHIVTLSYYKSTDNTIVTSESTRTLTFEAMAGRKYWIIPGTTRDSAIWNPYITDVTTRDSSDKRIMNCRYYYNLDDLSIETKEDVRLISSNAIGTVVSIDGMANRLVLQDEYGVITLDITDTRFRKVVKSSNTTKDNQKGRRDISNAQMITVNEIKTGDEVKIDFLKKDGKYIAIGIDKILHRD